MPYSYAVYTGNGSTTQFNVPFPYIRKEHVGVSINYVATTAFTWVNDSTLQMNVAPANGARVEVRRVTPVNEPLVNFTDGSTLVAADLDINALQQTYVNQEQDDQIQDGIKINSQGLLDAGGKRITNVGAPSASTDAATKGYVDTNDALKVNKAGDTMSGPLAMGGNKVTGLGDPTNAQDAVTKNWVETTGASPLVQFRSIFYGAFPTDQATDPYGGAPTEGDLYFNSTLKQMRVFNGASWQEASADATITRFQYTATNGQTSVAGADNNGQVLTYDVALEMVYVNGAMLARGVDYTATNGSSITGLAPLTAGDFVEVVALSQINAIGSIPGASIADGTITESKLANGAVTSGKIADGTIVNADVNANAGIAASKLSFTQSGTGAVARTVDGKLKDIVNVKDFGAVGDGVTDDTSAFNLAIARLNTIANPAELVVSGGNFVINGSLTPIITRNKWINCYGGQITHNGGTLFTFGNGSANGVSGGGVCGLDYSCPDSPSAGTTLLSIEKANIVTLRDIRGMVNVLLKAGLNGFAGGYVIENVQISTRNNGQTVIEHGSGAVSRIKTLVMTAVGVSRVLDESTPIGATATAIKFGAGGWDTGIWEGLLINGYLHGLQVDRVTANTNVSNFRVNNFYFDYCSNGIELRNTEPGGGINNWFFSNGWVTGMDGHGVHLVGSIGLHVNIQFQNVQSLLAGKNNWRLASSGMRDVVLRSCVGEFANRLNGTNTGNERDDFVALFGGWTVSGCRFGKSANNFVVAGVPNWQGRYGVNIGTNIADYILEGTRMEGATADCSMNYTATKVSSGNKHSAYIRNNVVAGGASKPAYAGTTPSLVAAPASLSVQTNDTPFTITLYFYGGTINQVQHNGGQVSAGPTSITLAPGETWMVSYSVAPTIMRVVLP